MTAPQQLETDWMDYAECVGVPHLFFGDEGGHEGAARAQAAKAICATCPVFNQCDTYATIAGVEAGIWAGRERTSRSNNPAPRTTSDERRAEILELVADLGSATAAEIAEHTSLKRSGAAWHLRTLAADGHLERTREQPTGEGARPWIYQLASKATPREVTT